LVLTPEDLLVAFARQCRRLAFTQSEVDPFFRTGSLARLCCLLLQIASLKLAWAYPLRDRVLALTIVEDFDVFEDGAFGLVMA
jgi:hypothetical protein